MTSLIRRLLSRADAADEASALRVSYRQVFGSPSGQEVLADLMRNTGLSRSSFVPGDPGLSAFHEGQRRVGLYIIDMVNSDPDAAASMLRAGDTNDLFGGGP